MSYDVVTLGETMIRLTPPDFKRIEQAISFDIEIGGTESNTAVGLTRLGLNVAWLSRLPESALGHLVADTLMRYGVDTSHVVWSETDRLGLYFLEEGKAPRGSSVIYDRADSAISLMTPDELPSDLFVEKGARLLHLTGITPAIGEAAAATARRALELAKAAGWLVSFDQNYRAKLWSPGEARDGCEPFAQAADLLFFPLRDAQLIYELGDLAAEQLIARLAKRYPQATIVLTMGGEGAMAREPDGEVLHQPAYPSEVVDRLGGGDAFSAGFLYGYLLGEDDLTENGAQLGRALKWGVAAAAVKRTIRGDIPLFRRAEVASVMEEEAGAALRR